MVTHTMGQTELSIVPLLCSLLICFGCICFAFVFLQPAVAAPWQQPIKARREGSRQMQNLSLLLLDINQTSDTPGSFDWQIRALGENHRERSSMTDGNKTTVGMWVWSKLQ